MRTALAAMAAAATIIAAAGGATAQPPAEDTRFALSISASSSRGAYQAGVLSALVAHFRQNRRQPAVAPQGAPLVFSGVSLGGLNALGAAALWCARDADDTPIGDNLLWSMWRDLDWSYLFPGDLSCGEYADAHPDLGVRCSDRGASPYGSGEAALTLNGTNAVRRQLVTLLSATGQARAGCRAIVTLSVDSELPARLPLGAHSIASSRRHAAVELRALPDPCPGGGACTHSLEICQVKSPITEPTESLHLPLAANQPPADATDPCHRISLAALLEVLNASSALPPFLAPQTVHHCGKGCPPADSPGMACPAGQQLCASRFNDAAFDQQPISAATAVLQSGDASHPALASSVRHVIIGPTSDRFRRGDGTPPAWRGYRHYSRQVDNFIDVATNYELQLLARFRKLGEKVSVVGRDLPLVGDLEVFESVPLMPTVVMGSAAFFDVEFRRHDFAVGVVDGLRWLARQAACGNTGLGPCPSPEAEDAAFELLADRSNARNFTAVRFLIERSRQPARPPRDIPEYDSAVPIYLALRSAAGQGNGYGPFAEALEQSLYRDRKAPGHISDYRAWRLRTTQQLLRRLEMRERELGSTGAATGLSFAQYLTAVGVSRSMTGWSLGPNTVPRRMVGSGKAAVFTKLVLPAYLAGNVAHAGLEVGWEPFAYSWRRARLQFPVLALQYADNLGDAGEAWALGAAPLVLAALPRGWLLPEAGIRPFLWWNPQGRPGRDLSFGGELFIRPLYSRLEISVGLRDLLYAGNRGGTNLSLSQSFFVNVGIADFSGLVYWAVRALGDDRAYESAGAQVLRLPGQLMGQE